MAAQVYVSEPIAAMAPVRPPRPANDELMTPVCGAVEVGLAQAGYLR